jgi:hypothetical protein
MLQVELIVRAERSTILLPTSLVGSSAHTFDEEDTFNKAVSLSIPEIQLQLRLHDYYMGMHIFHLVFLQNLLNLVKKCP